MPSSEPTKQRRRRSILRAHPGAVMTAIAFNIAAWATPTSVKDAQVPRPAITLGAPVETIMWAGLRNRSIDAQAAGAFLSAQARDEVMNWAYMYLPREVEAYYHDFEAAIVSHCKGQLAKCPKPLQEYGATLYKNFRFTPEYRAWDRARREEFLLRAANDPVLVNARAYWNVSRKSPHHINLGERREIIRHVIAMYNDVYAQGHKDFRPARFVTMDLHPEIAGQYAHGLHEIRMRGNDLLWKPFDNVMRIAVHEARHSVQAQLAALTQSREGLQYLQSKGIAREVRIFALIIGPGRPSFTSVQDDGYKTSPVEMDAYARQQDGNKIGIGDVPVSVLFSQLDEADRSIEAQRRGAAQKYGFSTYVRSVAPRAPIVQ